jgi:hypothetical protein
VVTVKVYAVSAVRPPTAIGEEEPDAVTPPGIEVTVYVAISLPSYVAATKVTLTTAPLAVAVTLVGDVTNFPPPAILPNWFITFRSSHLSDTTRLFPV